MYVTYEIFYRVSLKVRTDTAELILNCLILRKRLDGKLQSESTNIAKTKRDADFEGTEEPIFGKKPRVEESITEDLRYNSIVINFNDSN